MTYPEGPGGFSIRESRWPPMAVVTLSENLTVSCTYPGGFISSDAAPAVITPILQRLSKGRRQFPSSVFTAASSGARSRTKA